MMNLKEPKPKMEWDWQLVIMIMMPVVAVLVVTGAVVFSLSDQMHWGFALLIGLILGVVATAISIGQQGNGSIEIMVASGIVIIMTLLLFPVFNKARQNAEKRRARDALSLQSRPAPTPPPAKL